MNIKNLKIATQIRIAFISMLLFIIALGVLSYSQSNRLHLQTVSLYEHPFKVRSAIGVLYSDIYALHSDMKDLLMSLNKKEITQNITLIDELKISFFDQLDILYSNYLGPRQDIDTVKTAFIKWNSIREETLRLLLDGKKEEAAYRAMALGREGEQVKEIIKNIKVIDKFALAKSQEFLENSDKLRRTLAIQLLSIVLAILLIIRLINHLLMRNIKTPINRLLDTTKKFHEGDMDARCTYSLRNEFGKLSESFNTLIEGIQRNNTIERKVSTISNVMLSENEDKRFFNATLSSLIQATDSQMAAIYLLSKDKMTFDHLESIGYDANARKSFDANNSEGEFGQVLSVKKIQHTINRAQDSQFLFNTVSGKFVPKEIITVPLVIDNEVIAIISLATINNYSQISLNVINRIIDTISARIQGILAYKRMKELLEKLDFQNRELESQKTELSAQSAELLEQNTELEMQKQQLSEASRLKTNFLSNMSHELRTPLNSVIALSGVLSRRLSNKISEDEYSFLEVIERNGKHLLTLINDILDIARIEAGKEEIEISKFDINNLIYDVKALIEPQASIREIAIIQHNKENQIFISSDAEKCRHILQNIIGNAVKFTEKGKVEITAVKTESDISIIILDTGIGISESNLPHIFDEFRQADGGTSRRFGGTGLGLAIAKKYAALIGGTISVKSKLDVGTEFTVTLPLSLSANKSPLIEEQSLGRSLPFTPPVSKPFSSTFKTVLLVEDSEPAVIQIKDFLEESGYQILVAKNGAEALETISRTIPDAMILDLMMPDVDGFDVLKTIREVDITAHIPVLILTAKQISGEELKLLKRNNIHQLIHKGYVNREELQKSVASMVFPVQQKGDKGERKFEKIQGRALILVVEDNPDSMITAKALLSESFDVIEAIDGCQGVEMAKKHHPNLVLMDIALPGMDGIETFRVIKSDVNLADIPVIALTASAMTSDREAILAHGFDAYIAKPIDDKVFFKTISEVLYGK